MAGFFWVPAGFFPAFVPAAGGWGSLGGSCRLAGLLIVDIACEEKVRKGEVGADESYAIAGERRGCEGAREEELEDRRAKNLRAVGRSLLG